MVNSVSTLVILVTFVFKVVNANEITYVDSPFKLCVCGNLQSAINLSVERLFFVFLCSLQQSIDCVAKQNYTLLDVMTAF